MKLLEERVLYRKYQEFFEIAEKKRRWNVFEDIPWELAEKTRPDSTLALCAETFCGVESYLPDYVAQGLNVLRDSFGQTWWQINWGYEESKHALALREYLVQTGQRTKDQMYSFEEDILSRRWVLPFETPRQMVCYGALQEKVTWMIYRKQMQAATNVGDELLTSVYRHISRDEAAHGSFYLDVVAVCAEEDRAGLVDDLSLVLSSFTMPAYDLVPDYESRVEVMRSVGIDAPVFFREVVMPMLRRVGVNRRELRLSRPKVDRALIPAGEAALAAMR